MLILTRRIGESLCIGDNIKVTVPGDVLVAEALLASR